MKERALVEARQEARRRDMSNVTLCDDGQDDRLQSFLDGLLVLSVALDETAIVSSDNGAGKADVTSHKTTASTRPKCITCDGEACPSEPGKRKAVKSKAIKAMAEDGVDISSFFPKSIREITPQILNSIKENHSVSNEQTALRINLNTEKSSARRVLGFLEKTSKDMSFAYAGIINHNKPNIQQTSSNQPPTPHQNLMVDNLIVLCSCSTLKRRLSEMSKQTFDWDIDAPTDAAKSGEGDAAYTRVSRQIKAKVDGFLNNLKKETMEAAAIQ